MTLPNPAPVCLRTLGACSCPKCEPSDPFAPGLKCGECLMERVEIVALVNGVCPKCGAYSRTHTPTCREPVDHDGPCDPAWDVE